MAVLVILFAIGAIGIGIEIFSYRRVKRRREELQLVARQLGLSYSQVDMVGCEALPFQLLGRGDGRGTENVLDGAWQEMPVREFDYWYYDDTTDPNGDHSRSYSYFSCGVTEVDAELAPLTLVRENALTRFADAIGLDDIRFELEDLNRAFNVKCRDKKFANDFVDQRMMRWLLAADGAFAFEASGRWLLAYSRRRAPLELVPLLGTLKGFRDQVPRVVYDLYGPGSSG